MLFAVGRMARVVVRRRSLREIPASVSIRVSSWPDAPTNGRPVSSSCSPHASPTTTTLASRGPLVWAKGSATIFPVLLVDHLRGGTEGAELAESGTAVGAVLLVHFTPSDTLGAQSLSGDQSRGTSASRIEQRGVLVHVHLEEVFEHGDGLGAWVVGLVSGGGDGVGDGFDDETVLAGGDHRGLVDPARASVGVRQDADVVGLLPQQRERGKHQRRGEVSEDPAGGLIVLHREPEH